MTMTSSDLLSVITYKYACRMYWLSDLARTLGISRTEASALTIAAGYSRGKLVKTVTLADFENNTNVKYILNKINATAAKAP